MNVNEKIKKNALFSTWACLYALAYPLVKGHPVFEIPYYISAACFVAGLLLYVTGKIK